MPATMARDEAYAELSFALIIAQLDLQVLQ